MSTSDKQKLNSVKVYLGLLVLLLTATVTTLTVIDYVNWLIKLLVLSTANRRIMDLKVIMPLYLYIPRNLVTTNVP